MAAHILLPGAVEPLPGDEVRHGEPPAAAAVRAARAELGVDVQVTGVRTVAADVVDEPDRGLSVHTVRIVYGARTAGPSPGHGNEAGTGPVPAPDGRAPGDGGPPKVQRTGAYAIVLDGDRVLLSRYFRGGRWSLPGGGIHHGEQPVEALYREVHEETGLSLHGVRLIDVDSMHFTGPSPNGKVEDYHAVRIIYAGSVPLGARPQVVEVGGTTDAASWFPLDALEALEVTALVRTALNLRG